MDAGEWLSGDGSGGFLFGCDPCFGVLPIDVERVVDMEEQALSSVQETASNDVIVDKCERRINDRIQDEFWERGARLAFAEVERNGGCAVSPHVFDVHIYRGILIVEQVSAKLAGFLIGFGSGVGFGVFRQPGCAFAE